MQNVQKITNLGALGGGVGPCEGEGRRRGVARAQGQVEGRQGAPGWYEKMWNVFLGNVAEPGRGWTLFLFGVGELGVGDGLFFKIPSSLEIWEF